MVPLLLLRSLPHLPTCRVVVVVVDPSQQLVQQLTCHMPSRHMAVVLDQRQGLVLASLWLLLLVVAVVVLARPQRDVTGVQMVEEVEGGQMRAMYQARLQTMVGGLQHQQVVVAVQEVLHSMVLVGLECLLPHRLL